MVRYLPYYNLSHKDNDSHPLFKTKKVKILFCTHIKRALFKKAQTELLYLL